MSEGQQLATGNSKKGRHIPLDSSKQRAHRPGPFLVNGFVATYYPDTSRATALGWSLGMGRIGAILGPAIGGVVAASTLGYQWSFYVFSGAAGPEGRKVPPELVPGAEEDWATYLCNGIKKWRSPATAGDLPFIRLCLTPPACQAEPFVQLCLTPPAGQAEPFMQPCLTPPAGQAKQFLPRVSAAGCPRAGQRRRRRPAEVRRRS